MRRHDLPFVLQLILPGALAAQSHLLAGNWEISIPVGDSIENGVGSGRSRGNEQRAATDDKSGTRSASSRRSWR